MVINPSTPWETEVGVKSFVPQDTDGLIGEGRMEQEDFPQATRQISLD